MTNPAATIRRRRPPVRTILGERIRLRPLHDQAIAARCALSGRSFEHEWTLLVRSQLGI
jgi:hypothetical protein